jgi:hypothetical protein
MWPVCSGVVLVDYAAFLGCFSFATQIQHDARGSCSDNFLEPDARLYASSGRMCHFGPNRWGVRSAAAFEAPTLYAPRLPWSTITRHAIFVPPSNSVVKTFNIQSSTEY